MLAVGLLLDLESPPEPLVLGLSVGLLRSSWSATSLANLAFFTGASVWSSEFLGPFLLLRLLSWLALLGFPAGLFSDLGFLAGSSDSLNSGRLVGSS